MTLICTKIIGILMHSGKCSDRFDDRPYAHTTSVYRGLNPIRITVAFSSHTHEAQCEHIRLTQPRR
jgi:hypothetical protein